MRAHGFINSTYVITSTLKRHWHYHIIYGKPCKSVFLTFRERTRLLCDEEKISAEVGSEEMVRPGERTDEPDDGGGAWPGLGTQVDVCGSPSRELPRQRFVVVGAQ